MTQVRAESAADHATVRHVLEAAFDSPQEASLVEALRRSCDTLISLVGVVGGEVVGHILFTPVTIERCDTPVVAMGLAPMAVAPAHQRTGVGSALVNRGLEACRESGVALVVVLGHPEYYPRFGFVPAETKGLRCEYDVPPEAFMVLELRPGVTAGTGGTVRYRPEFADV
jgi:putative acetyltransferase